MDEAEADRPEPVDHRKAYDNTWSAEDFPLTPMEAWYVMRGYAVKPKKGCDVETLLRLPGRLELSNGYLMLWET